MAYHECFLHLIILQNEKLDQSKKIGCLPVGVVFSKQSFSSPLYLQVGKQRNV